MPNRWSNTKQMNDNKAHSLSYHDANSYNANINFAH